MKEITLGNNTYLLVEIKNKKPRDFSIEGCLYRDSTQMLWFNDIEGHNGTCEKQLPPGAYELLGLCRDISEEGWAQIVEDNSMGCWNNYKGIPDEKYTCLSATESAESLLRANNLSFDKTVILKKK